TTYHNTFSLHDSLPILSSKSAVISYPQRLRRPCGQCRMNKQFPGLSVQIQGLARYGQYKAAALTVETHPRILAVAFQYRQTRHRDRKSTRLNSSHVKIS